MTSQNDALLYRIYFYFFKSVLGKNFQSEIQIGITFEWIGVFRCGFQQSFSHYNFYHLQHVQCLVKNLFLPFQLVFKHPCTAIHCSPRREGQTG